MTFDITDTTNKYNPCPGCGAMTSMGLMTRSGRLRVACMLCGFDGPGIPGPPSSEKDRRAFDAWNALPRKGASDAQQVE